MKKLVIALSIVIMLFSVNMAAFAQVNVTLTYTADNEVTGFWHQLDGTTLGLPLGMNFNNWELADSYSAVLGYGPIHEFIWEVKNWETTNWGGFLAEISPASVLYPPSSNSLTDMSWDVFVSYSGHVDPWNIQPTDWKSASMYGANNGSTVWHTVHGGPIAGIDGAAQWIWGPNNPVGPGPNARVYVKANVNVVPEPGTMLLLGSGLLGLGIIARFRRKKS